MLDAWLSPRLDEIRARGLWRQSRTLASLPGGRIRVEGLDALNLASNDYLGLAAEGGAVMGGGAGASPLVTGHSDRHQALCDRLGDWLGFESVRLFSSGFAANVGVLSLFGDQTIYHDRLNHASLIDGSRHNGGRFRRFPHLDYGTLKGWLSEPALVVSDGVFSMDGDTADLQALKALGQPLLVDDAHGIGVLGKSGAGLCEQQGVKPDILVGTFGKALGAGGAFVAGSRALGQAIDNLCREYIYSTALPLGTVAQVQANLDRLACEPWRREQVLALATWFQAQCRERALPVLPSATPIQPLLCQDAGAALALSRALLDKGFYCPAIRPPTVPQARLRITLNSNLDQAQLAPLLDALEAHRDCLA
ncbi:8-amino-7-oxononanoate synthase [Gallaecimonas sp. GXIMD4217]|uniref:aminotransferase class I/II-fold pyridoxal phosphate-dependent enzyme n=1 Tax=Gallaecimonas sp. GXIMD4217 TaxID=3131927 RepID=UPI00311B37E5